MLLVALASGVAPRAWALPAGTYLGKAPECTLVDLIDGSFQRIVKPEVELAVTVDQVSFLPEGLLVTGTSALSLMAAPVPTIGSGTGGPPPRNRPAELHARLDVRQLQGGTGAGRLDHRVPGPGRRIPRARASCATRRIARTPVGCARP
jgi:hypothetical protein